MFHDAALTDASSNWTADPELSVLKTASYCHYSFLVHFPQNKKEKRLVSHEQFPNNTELIHPHSSHTSTQQCLHLLFLPEQISSAVFAPWTETMGPQHRQDQCSY